ncbi:MAG: hypothetical protein O6939_07410 [Bacteroidetes bacterium]|nr:hypothetical protein [Bacteroidota bacterium]
MKRRILIFTFLALYFNFTYAQGKEVSDKNWHVRISPYFWFIGFEGTVYRPPVPTILPEPPPSYEFDLSFKEISKSIKYAMMLAGEYRAKNIISIFHYTGLILEGDAITPIDLILQNTHLRLSYHSGDLSVGYRFVKTNKWEVDGLAGFKFIFFSIEGKSNLAGMVPIKGNRSESWADPIFGARIIYSPIKKLEFMVYGDVGGFLIGPELNNQFIGGISYFFSNTFFTSLGYRHWHLKVDETEAIYNGKVKGWLVRIGFQF